jgi:Coenzyme PQQ synthesis protein D (PqqD)
MEDAMYELASHVRSVADSDGTTVLDLQANLILALNQTGAFIWERIKDGHSFDDIVDSLVEATRMDRIDVETDTREFMQDLVKRGLLLESAHKG